MRLNYQDCSLNEIVRRYDIAVPIRPSTRQSTLGHSERESALVFSDSTLFATQPYNSDDMAKPTNTLCIHSRRKELMLLYCWRSLSLGVEHRVAVPAHAGSSVLTGSPAKVQRLIPNVIMTGPRV